MPHANIWVRREDWEKWQAIESKAEWLHSKLSVPITKEVYEESKFKKEVGKKVYELLDIPGVKRASEVKGFIPKSFSARKGKS